MLRTEFPELEAAEMSDQALDKFDTMQLPQDDTSPGPSSSP